MSAPKLNMFARLLKVDLEARKVYGVIADETPDAANEVFDYEKSKPNFIEWSTGLAKATNGESVGNVRAMHGKVVAGKLDELVCDDVTKSITVCADIVDDNEWKKVTKGCYTGFSIGGSYGDKTPIEGGLVKYEAKPTEVSLVDIPCNPNATFTLVTKSTGAEELRKFATAPDTATDEIAVVIASDGVALLLAKALGLEALPEGLTAENAAYGIVLHKRLSADDADPDVAATLKAAISLAPQLFKVADSDKLQKGLWTVKDLAGCMQQLSWCANDAINEEAWENDEASTVPATLRSALKLVGKALIDMCKEEVGELLATYETEAAKAAPAGELAKADVPGDLSKAIDDAIDDASEEGLRELVKTLQAERAQMHDMLKALNVPEGTLWADIPALLKAAAPCGHSDGDMAKVQGVLDEATTALNKARADNTLLKARITALENENTALKATPAVNPPALVAVTKGGSAAVVTPNDTPEPTITPVLEKDGSINEVATMIKAIHANGPVGVMRK